MRARHRQSGAVAVFAAVTFVAAVIAIAIAVDVGRLYYAQQDLKRIASAAAIDAARVASECLGTVSDRQSAAEAEVLSSVLRNSGDAEYLGANAVSIGVMRGSKDVARTFEATPRKGEYPAVQVSLKAPAPGRLIPGLTSDSTATLRATAAAAARVNVVQYPWPRGANITGPGSPLLGYGPVDLDLVSPAGLVSGSVNLGDLAREFGVDSVSELETVSVPATEFLDVIAGLLTGAARDSVEAMEQAADASRTVTLGNIFSVPEGYEDQAQDAMINAAALVVAGAYDASDGIDFSVAPCPSCAPAEVHTRIIESPTIGIGPPGFDETGQPLNAAHSAQISVELDLPSSMLGTLSGLSLVVKAVKADTRVDSVECPRRGLAWPKVVINPKSDVATLALGTFRDITAADPEILPVTVLDLRPLVPARITVYAETELGTEEDNDRPLIFEGPYSDMRSFGVPLAGATANALADLANNLQIGVEPPSMLSNPVFGAQVQAAKNLVTAQVQLVLRQIDAVALDPALATAGVTIGGAEVHVTSVETSAPFIFAR